MKRPPRTGGTAGKHNAERGFSLWELTILLGVVAVIAIVGLALLKAGQPGQRETDRLSQLTAADKALQAFAAANGRLPCPDTTGDGSENCTAGVQKGWLPSAALAAYAPSPLPGTLVAQSSAGGPIIGLPRLRYIVYRTSTDLGQLVSRYEPVQYSGTPDAVAYTFGSLSVLDFCVGLNTANAATTAAPSTTAAYIPGAGSAVINVAYGLAEGGEDKDGDGNPFDGLNAPMTGAPVLESPSRAAAYDYDDRVLVRTFSDLSSTLDCAQATRSLDAMAHAVDVHNEVAASQKAMVKNAAVLAAAGYAKGIVSGIKVGVSVAAVGAAVTALGVASAGLSGAIASCFVLVGCAFIPVYAAAVAEAAVAIGLGAAAVALNAAALGVNIAAAAEATQVAQVADGLADPGPVDLTSYIQGMTDAVTDATTKAAAANAAATVELNNKNANFTNWNCASSNPPSNCNGILNIYAAAHPSDPNNYETVAAYTTYVCSYGILGTVDHGTTAISSCPDLVIVAVHFPGTLITTNHPAVYQQKANPLPCGTTCTNDSLLANVLNQYLAYTQAVDSYSTAQAVVAADDKKIADTTTGLANATTKAAASAAAATACTPAPNPDTAACVTARLIHQLDLNSVTYLSNLLNSPNTDPNAGVVGLLAKRVLDALAVTNALNAANAAADNYVAVRNSVVQSDFIDPSYDPRTLIGCAIDRNYPNSASAAGMYPTGSDVPNPGMSSNCANEHWTFLGFLTGTNGTDGAVDYYRVYLLALKKYNAAQTNANTANAQLTEAQNNLVALNCAISRQGGTAVTGCAPPAPGTPGVIYNLLNDPLGILTAADAKGGVR